MVTVTPAMAILVNNWKKSTEQSVLEARNDLNLMGIATARNQIEPVFDLDFY